MWHLRLGHISHDGLNAIMKQKLDIGIASLSKWELCSGCALGKQTRVNFQATASQSAKYLLDVVHSDVCGPMQSATFSVKRYFVKFIDDMSRFCAVYLFRSKSDVLDKFTQFAKFADSDRSLHQGGSHRQRWRVRVQKARRVLSQPRHRTAAHTALHAST